MAEGFELNSFLDELKSASRGASPTAEVRQILDRVFADPSAVASGMPAYEQDDKILFEDDAVSIWFCRFRPGDPVPPHDHQISVSIGVYEGVEKNSMYRADANGGIEVSSVHELGPGDVFSIGPTGIHSVICGSEAPSLAIHVYLGNLSEVERNLFDPRTGERMRFSDEDVERLKPYQQEIEARA